LKPGQPYIFKRLFKPWIINFPIEDDWRSISKIQDSENGIDVILKNYKEWGVTSLAIPALGCGNDQLEWAQVGPLLYLKFRDIDIPVELYAPFQTPKEQLKKEFLSVPGNQPCSSQPSREAQKFRPEWLILIEIVDQIRQNHYYLPIGRTFFQKIGYVVTTIRNLVILHWLNAHHSQELPAQEID